MGRGSKEMDETWGNFPSCPNNINGEKNLRRECNQFFFFFFFFQGMKKMFVSVVTAPTYLNPYLMLGETTQAIMLLTTTQTVNFKLESDGTQGEGAF